MGKKSECRLSSEIFLSFNCYSEIFTIFLKIYYQIKRTSFHEELVKISKFFKKISLLFIHLYLFFQFNRILRDYLHKYRNTIQSESELINSLTFVKLSIRSRSDSNVKIEKKIMRGFPCRSWEAKNIIKKH